jgi:hypothetical protein
VVYKHLEFKGSALTSATQKPLIPGRLVACILADFGAANVLLTAIIVSTNQLHKKIL